MRDPEPEEVTLNHPDTGPIAPQTRSLSPSFAVDPTEPAETLHEDRHSSPSDPCPVPSLAGLPQVPGYEVMGELGRGGMGVVYKARHLKLKRIVALKMILAGAHTDSENLARFQSEAEAVACLQHPNIVQVFDIGEHNGLPYFSLEFVEGGNLASHTRGTPQPIREAARLVETLARAVHVAHRSRIVHRDLKPANVLLTGEGVPKITDFGLAKQLDGSGMQTQSGTLLGTPAYMAPEQAQGKTREIGPAADIYALGAILYDLLTGRPPFKGETAWETVSLVISAPPLPPSQLQGEVPPELEAICLKCLCKDPQKRYATAEALADALQPFRDEAMGLAVRPGVGRGPKRWITMAALGGLLAGLLCLGIWLVIRGNTAENPAPGNHSSPTGEKPKALSGELSLKVWTPGPGGKRGLTVGEDQDALPVRKGELVHLEARLNQPGYIYLIWVDSQGNVDPLYPWDRDFKVLPKPVSPQEVLHSPTEESRGWPVQGVSGLETALLLARRTPLPEGTDLTEVVGKLSPSPLRDPKEVVVRGFDAGQPASTIYRAQKRQIGAQAQQIDEPLLQLMDRLRPHFEMIRAVRFAYQSE